MITSAHNSRIQWVRKLQSQPRLRRQEGLFVVEGVRLVEESVQSGWTTRLVLYSGGLSARGQALLKQYIDSGVPVEEASDKVMDSASDTHTPQGILAVVEQRQLELPGEPDFILVADGLRDPGNLGTLLRTAAAAGVQAVVLPPGSVDPFSPKVVRAAMGAHFRLPLRSLEWDALRQLIPQEARIFLADAAGGEPYTRMDFKVPLAIIVGGEAQGAGTRAASLAQHRVHISMAGEVESLNAAVAAAVLLFEVRRQRIGS